MKKETLEEAAKKWIRQFKLITKKESFIEGAKWQQQNSYSEEDMRKAYFSAIESTGEGWNGEYADGNHPDIEKTFNDGFQEWFEQFKNK